MIDASEQQARKAQLKQLRQSRQKQRALACRHRRLSREHASYELGAEKKVDQLSRDIRELEGHA